jgi:hypothetical protein
MRRYLRFRTNVTADDAATLFGVFYGLARLMEREAMDRWSANRAADVCDWFNRNLPVPRLAAPTVTGAFTRAFAYP